jgi:hypothetical protein
MSAADVGQAIAASIQPFQPFVEAWSATAYNGVSIVASTPSLVRSILSNQSDFQSLEDAHKAEILRFIGSKIVAQSEQSPNSVDPDILSLWTKILQPEPLPPPHGGGVQNQVHGGGGLPPPPPYMSQQQLQSSWLSPHLLQKPKGFVFGGKVHALTPIQLAPQFASPSAAQFAHHVQPAALFASNPGTASLFASPVAPASQFALHAAQVAQFAPQSLTGAVAASSQPHPAVQPMPADVHAQFPNLSSAFNQQNNPNQLPIPHLQQLQAHMAPPVWPTSPPSIFQPGLQAAVAQPLYPWEEEAIARPQRAQDPNMMPGFTRRSIATIIEAAKKKRMAIGPEAARTMFVEQVVYPQMKTFSAQDFLTTRTKFNAAVKASFTSCIFKEFKDCMVDTCRTDAQRFFGNMADEDWILLDDIKLQNWLAIHFGPNSKEEAMERLSAVKFPEHSDVHDCQSTFVNKLGICAYEFELVINDIADTHMRWITDKTQLCSGELTPKEVMEIWKKKFPKQEKSVFSCQLKTCRDYLDREKDVLFCDLIRIFSNHFTKMDTLVKQKKLVYTTTPTKKRQIEAESDHKAEAKRSDWKLDKSSTFGKRSRDSDGPPPPRQQSSAKANPTPSKRKPVPGHMRGISCGTIHNHFGLGCSDKTCVIWGTKWDKNKNGHTWKDSDQEPTVVIERAEYDALIAKKPGILQVWMKAKDTQKKTKQSARISAISSGAAVDSSSEENDDATGLRDEFNENAAMSDSDNDAVNPELCVVSALAASKSRSSAAITAILSEHQMRQFFGVSRVLGPNDQTTLVRTLLDPGANYNVVSTNIRDLCAIESVPICLGLFQGSKKQCVVEELCKCRFELQNSHKEFVKHVEWCLCADLGYELLLGRKFNHDNGFTKFHELLSEWNDISITKDNASASIQATAGVPTECVFLKFKRIDTPHGEARNKRNGKNFRCAIPLTASANAIAESDLTASNPLSAINILDSRDIDGRKQILLHFQIECTTAAANNLDFKDWFDISKDVPKGQVFISTASAAADIIVKAGNRRPLNASPTVAENSAASNPVVTSDCRQSADIASATSSVSRNKMPPLTCQADYFPSSFICDNYSPLLTSDNLAVARFSRKNARGRTAQVAVIDMFAAHNVINASLLANPSSDFAIRQFDRIDNDDFTLVLLEFALKCDSQHGSALRLREWFRVENMRPQAPHNIVIRGIFDESRLSAAIQAQQPRGYVEKEFSRDDNVAGRQREVEGSNNFEAKAKTMKRSVEFTSFHPVSHYRLHRNVDRPPLKPCDLSHTSYLHKSHIDRRQSDANRSRQNKNDTISAALKHAELMRQIANSKKALRAMIDRMPEDKQSEERASVSALLAPMRQRHSDTPRACLSNFEQALDVVNDDILSAHIAALSTASDDCDKIADISWVGDDRFKPGAYVEVQNAKTTIELNGRRVRIYDKTDTPLVWRIRVLGKNSGLWKCHEKFLAPLPLLEQARSAPAPHNTGFLDVAIDEKGQPTGELPQMVHRQFGEEYSAELTAQIDLLKKRYPTVFTSDVTEPCGFEKMKIRLIPNAILPSKSRWYRNTPLMKQEVKRQIQEQLDWGAIRREHTAHCSDILLVKRPHMPGKWRFVINFQKLNDATVPEQLIMPDPANQHARLAGCKIFGALDLSSYFRQLQLDEDSQYLTGFASDEGTFVHTRVPMGIRNAPSFAQRVLQEKLAIDPILGPLGIKNYFDDVPFGAKTEEEFLRIMTAMLDFCVQWKLKINPEKSIFGVKSITHVGFVVSEHGVAIDPERTRDISELQSPKSLKKVQSVLGVLNYVRNFVPNFSAKAKHLTDKLAAAPPVSFKGAPAPKTAPKFEWSEEDQRQFNELKACVLAAPLLAQLDYSKQIYVRCDASRFGAGAVLFQYDDQGREFVACYASRKFLPAETRWSTFQQEASTVVWALERFREFTQGYNVIVECDHRNISFVKRSAMPQLARWRMRLQDHDFTIRFLSGAQNLTADGLSRSHVDDVEVTLLDAMPECSLLYATPSSTVDCAQVSALECAAYNTRRASLAQQALASHEIGSDDEALDNDAASVSSSDDSSDESENDEAEQRFGPHGEIVEPDGSVNVQQELQPDHVTAPFVTADDEIKVVHNDLAGHNGVYVTLQRLLRNGRSWGSRKQMLDDIDSFLSGCPVCQKMKKRRDKVAIDRHVISGSPFAEISIDVLKLPTADIRGFKYCIVIVDNFSHWVSLYACANKSAFDAARALMQFIGNFGAPLRLRSDGGKEFVNGVIVGLTRMMGVSPVVVEPYTPTANGIVERANRAILERTREMCMSERLVKHTSHQWSDLLPMVQRTLNASFHSAIGTSPAKILFGDCLDLDRAILTKIPDGKKFDTSVYCDVMAINQRVIIEEANRIQEELCKKVIAKAAAKQRSHPPAVFSVNDWVLVKPQPKYPLHKLAPRWPGPFRIHQLSANSEKVILLNTVNNQLFSALKRQLESFNISRVSDVAGLTKVAEADNFEFPVEQIIGHALLSNDDELGANPIQLHQSFVRGVRPKRNFQFLVKWTGYEEPTWVAYKDAKKYVQFPGYVSVFPNLNLL